MVSIHIVPVIVYLIINVINLLFRFKRGTEMPRPNEKVLRKPLYTDMEITAPRIRMETIIPSLVYGNSFSGFSRTR